MYFTSEKIAKYPFGFYVFAKESSINVNANVKSVVSFQVDLLLSILSIFLGVFNLCLPISMIFTTIFSHPSHLSHPR